MKKIFAKINLIIFPFILTIALFISTLQSYQYFEFFQKHFSKLPYLIYLVSFISFIFLLISKGSLRELKSKHLVQIFLGGATMAFFIFVLLYVVLNELEVFYYINFSYVTFHIRPASLIFPVLLSFEAVYLFFITNPVLAKFDKKIYNEIKPHIHHSWKLVKKPSDIIYVAFPFLAGFTFILVLLETYSYIGFLRKYIFVDSRFFIVLTLVSNLILSTTIKNQEIESFLNNLFFKVNRVAFPFLLIIYLIMQVFESVKFHNYVFSTTHLQPGNFIYFVILSGGILILSKMKEGVDRISLSFNHLPKFDGFLKVCIFSILFFLLVDNLAITVHEAVGTDMYVLSHMNSSYDQKMQNYWGFFYEYMVFVKDNTPENSTIMIPPQELPWFSTGNEALVWYFLYPRNLEQGKLETSLSTKSVNYILLAWGEWTDPDSSKYGWPKAKIDAEKIIYFNGDKNWGIIEVKK